MFKGYPQLSAQGLLSDNVIPGSKQQIPACRECTLIL